MVYLLKHSASIKYICSVIIHICQTAVDYSIEKKLNTRILKSTTRNRQARTKGREEKAQAAPIRLSRVLIMCMRHSTKYGLDPWTGPKIELKVGPKIRLKIRKKKIGRRLLCERFGSVYSECYVILSVQPDMFTRFLFIYFCVRAFSIKQTVLFMV